MNRDQQRDILLKELRLRFKYGLKCRWGETSEETGILTDIVKVECEDGFSYYDCYFDNDDNNDVLIDLVCPMLRPLSSITIEEGKEFYEKFGIKFSMLNSILSEIKGYGTSDMRYLTELIDWLNTKQFDYNNLIELGIACKLS